MHQVHGAYQGVLIFGRRAPLWRMMTRTPLHAVLQYRIVFLYILFGKVEHASAEGLLAES